MSKETISVVPGGREEALMAIWDIIDVGGRVDRIVKRNTSGSVAKRGNGGDSVPEVVTTPVEIPNSLADRIVKRGISSRVVDPLGALLGVGKAVVAGYLCIDRRTASRRASKDLPLPTHAAEAVLRLLELDRMAVDTFASQAASSSWLLKPHPVLDGESPLECARSSYGAQRVKGVLVAIKYGGAL